MALSEAQKAEINRRAQSESGASLAAEFGISASMVSKLKNHYVPAEGSAAPATSAMPTQEAAPAKTTAAKAESGKKRSSAKTAAAPTKTTASATPTAASTGKKHTVLVSSANLNMAPFEVEEGCTFGQLLTIAQQDSKVKAIFQKAKNRSELENLKTVLPLVDGETLHLFLVPTKTDAGCLCL